MMIFTVEIIDNHSKICFDKYIDLFENEIEIEK